MMISAVVVSSNDRDTIERCLRSLRDQTERVDEILVVDGGSRDGSLETARSLADEVLVLGRGIGLDRVKGIRKARNDLILSCDGDSIYPPHHSQVARETLTERNAGNGPIYPLKQSFLGNWESYLSKIQRGSCYGMNLCLRKDIFLRLSLDADNLYWLRRADIGEPVQSDLNPKWDPRFYCFTRLPTTLFSVLGTPLETFERLSRASHRETAASKAFGFSL